MPADDKKIFFITQERELGLYT